MIEKIFGQFLQKEKKETLFDMADRIDDPLSAPMQNVHPRGKR